MKFVDLTGQRFGSLVAVNLAGARDRQTYWVCQCDCGNRATVRVGDLRRKDGSNAKSCGCRRNLTHGLARRGRRHPLYKVWYAMKQRCQNPNHRSYENYGGRGIRVCTRWQKFENFYEDVKRLYVSWLTMDRIDNDKGYEPGNVRWMDKGAQNRNRRSSEQVFWDRV